MTTTPVIASAEDGEWLDVLGTRLKFLCKSNDTDGGYSCILNTVPLGSGAPPHKHPWDEAVFVAHGEVEFQLEDSVRTLSAGSFVLVPADHVHAFKGCAEEDAELVIFDVPSHSNAFFQEIHDTVRELPADLQKMPAIGQRHRVTLL